jgi:hypothetical protein
MSDYLDKKLEQARDNAKGYGNLRGLKETADEEFKAALATIREDCPKDLTAPDKEAWVRRQPAAQGAIEIKAKRYADWVAAEVYMKILFAEVDKYRTDAASNRGLDARHR